MAKQTFEKWMEEVDGLISSRLGLSSADLRDRNWRDEYEDGSTPEQAVEEELGDLDGDLEEVMMNELFG